MSAGARKGMIVCTVSVIEVAGGFRLVTNRDEKRVRAMAEFPQRWGKQRVSVGPFDPAGGGTWVASRPGLTLCLLNMKLEEPLPPPDPRVAISRGRIIPGLIDETGAERAMAGLDRLDLARFMPFRLVAAERVTCGVRVMLARWDGCDLEVVEVESGPFVAASSGLGDAIVQRRVPQFRAMVETMGGTTEMQDAFHRFRWPQADHTSVLMSRPDARTVSITEVLDAEAGVEMRYRTVRDTGQIDPGNAVRLGVDGSLESEDEPACDCRQGSGEFQPLH